MTIASTNPTTGEIVRTFSPLTEKEIEARLAKAHEAARTWRRTRFAERAQRLTKAASLLEERKDALGRLMTLEMGKLRKAAVAEIEKCATGCRYYAENGEAHLAPEAVASAAKRSEKRFPPMGPVLAVRPWDFSPWPVFPFAAPARLARDLFSLTHTPPVP